MQSATTSHRRHLAVFTSALVVLSLAWSLAAAGTANASESKYCYNQTIGAHAHCTGALRNLNAVYGQGTHPVCVWAAYTSDGNTVVGGITCDSSAGEGTYNNKMFEHQWYPVIENNAGSSGTVYGLAFKP